VLTFAIMRIFTGTVSAAGIVGPAGMALAALVPLVLVAVAFDAFCLVDLARANEVRYLPKWVWVLVICLISAPIGGIAYLVAGRRR
jgi:Phospholipase_D-nuclease N-terminal